MKNTFWGMVGLITVCIIVFLAYAPPAIAKDPQKEDFLMFCVEKWDVTQTDLCFEAQAHAVDILRDFVNLNIEKVDVAARLCIDEHIYPKYNGVVDVVSVVGCMTEILEGEKSTILYKLPRI